MAKVPLSQGPSIGATQVVRPQASVDISRIDGGLNQARQNMSNAVNNFADTQAQIGALNQQRDDAREIDTNVLNSDHWQLEQKQSYDQMRGQQRIDNQPVYQQAYKDHIQQQANTITNPRARKAYLEKMQNKVVMGYADNARGVTEARNEAEAFLKKEQAKMHFTGLVNANIKDRPAYELAMALVAEGVKNDMNERGVPAKHPLREQTLNETFSAATVEALSQHLSQEPVDFAGAAARLNDPMVQRTLTPAARQKINKLMRSAGVDQMAQELFQTLFTDPALKNATETEWNQAAEELATGRVETALLVLVQKAFAAEDRDRARSKAARAEGKEGDLGNAQVIADDIISDLKEGDTEAQALEKINKRAKGDIREKASVLIRNHFAAGTRVGARAEQKLSAADRKKVREKREKEEKKAIAKEGAYDIVSEIVEESPQGSLEDWTRAAGKVLKAEALEKATDLFKKQKTTNDYNAQVERRQITSELNLAAHEGRKPNLTPEQEVLVKQFGLDKQANEWETANRNPSAVLPARPAANETIWAMQKGDAKAFRDVDLNTKEWRDDLGKRYMEVRKEQEAAIRAYEAQGAKLDKETEEQVAKMAKASAVRSAAQAQYKKIGNDADEEAAVTAHVLEAVEAEVRRDPKFVAKDADYIRFVQAAMVEVKEKNAGFLGWFDKNSSVAAATARGRDYSLKNTDDIKRTMHAPNRRTILQTESDAAVDYLLKRGQLPNPTRVKHMVTQEKRRLAKQRVLRRENRQEILDERVTEELSNAARGTADKLGPLGTEIVGQTPEGRPIIKNPDGTVSTERSSTRETPQGWVNFPTIFGAKERSIDEAFEIVKQAGFTDPETGRKLNFFPTVEAAIEAAKARSHNIEATPEQPVVTPPGSRTSQAAAPDIAAQAKRNVVQQIRNGAFQRRGKLTAEKLQTMIANEQKALEGRVADQKRLEDLTSIDRATPAQEKAAFESFQREREATLKGRERLQEVEQQRLGGTKTADPEEEQLLQELEDSIEGSDNGDDVLGNGGQHEDTLRTARQKADAVLAKNDTPKNRLIADEGGYVPESYIDKVKQKDGSIKEVLTGGAGHALVGQEITDYPPGTTIPDAVQKQWFKDDFAKATKQAKAFLPKGINPLAVHIVTNMIFNMGLGNTKEKTGVKGFADMLKALEESPPNYALAAIEMQDSIWFGQTGDRAKRLITRMRGLKNG